MRTCATAPLLLALLCAGQPALAETPTYRHHAEPNTTFLADTNLLPAFVGPTLGSSTKAVVTFSLTIAVADSTKVRLVKKRATGTVVATQSSFLNNNVALEAATETELSWKAYSGWVYQIQVDDATTGSFVLCEVEQTVALAGRPQSSSSGGGGSGDITAVTAGGGLTGGASEGAATLAVGAGTGITVNADDVALTIPVVETLGGTGQTTYTQGDLLFADDANSLAKLAVGASGTVLVGGSVPAYSADPTVSSIAATNTMSSTGNGKAKSFHGTTTAIDDLSIEFTDGATQTNTQETDVTFTTTINSLPPSGSCSTTTVLVTSTGGGSITYPSAWRWLGTKPTTLTAGQTLYLQLHATSNAESGVVACATVLGTGS